MTMRAMRLHAAHEKLRCDHLPIPDPGPGQLLVKVHACGVCRTDLHIVDGELTEPKLPLVPGHEIVGTVDALGPGVERHRVGDRVGVPWLGGSCGQCEFCQRGEENLCADARFTGYQLDGGYAEYALADARFCFAIPERYDDASAAPLLCAGLIGYRSLRFAGEARRLGIYGFGAAAHIVAQVAVAEGREVYAFTRAGDAPAQALARKVGARWAGGSQEPAPEPLDAAIIFAPVGALVPAALEAVRRGGIVVCGGIHMSAVGRTHAALGRKPHAQGRGRLSRGRRACSHRHPGRNARARSGERCARSPARRKDRRRLRARHAALRQLARTVPRTAGYARRPRPHDRTVRMRQS